MDDDWLSTGDVATLLGVSRQHVVDLCDRGALAVTRFGTHRRIRRADALGLVERPLTHAQEKSLWLHQAVLGELMMNPDRVLKTARDNLARWKTVHRADGNTVHYLNEWSRVIDGGVDRITAVLTGTDERSCELRQNSPFAGVLSDPQRQQVLRSFRQHWRREHGGTRAA